MGFVHLGCLNRDYPCQLDRLQLNSGHCCWEYLSKGCSLRTDRTWEVSVPESQLYGACLLWVWASLELFAGCTITTLIWILYGSDRREAMYFHLESHLSTFSPYILECLWIFLCWGIEPLPDQGRSILAEREAFPLLPHLSYGSCLLPPAHTRDAREWQMVSSGHAEWGVPSSDVLMETERAFMNAPSCFECLHSFPQHRGSLVSSKFGKVIVLSIVKCELRKLRLWQT